MPIEEAIAAGRIVIEVAEAVAPKAAEAGLNLLEVASTKAGLSIPAGIRAMVNVGPKDGLIELSHSAEAEIGKARAFEAASQTQYSLLSFASESEKISSLISSNTRYSLIGKMERGTRGAYLIRDEEQVKHILKLVSSDNVTPQISRSAQAAAAVDSLASRTPTYEEVKYTPGFGSWYVQELLPGKPALVPSDKLIEQMVALNSRQAGKAISDSENWTEKVLSQLRDDKFKWQKHVAASGPEGADLVTRVQTLIAKNSLTVPRGGDIVHGDFQHYNALVSSNDRLTGYVDWEGAGQGDRAIDLSRMLFDAYVSEAEIGYKANPATLEMLRDRVREISGTVALNQYMGYWILQVADYGNKVGPELFGKFLGVGRRIIHDLNDKSAIAKLAG
jgi:hypothetical protein